MTLLVLALSGTASADSIRGGVNLTTIQNGTVSGDLYLDSYLANTATQNVTYNFQPLPANAEVQWARLSTVVYCGHMEENRRGYVNTTFNGQQIGYEYLNASYILPVPNSQYQIWVNDHVNRVTSDYLIFYDVTTLVQQNNQVNINTIREDSNFDGRIKLINLIIAYNDGDSDQIKYWVNFGHDTCTSQDAPYVGVTKFTGSVPGNVDNVTARVIHVASIDGSYQFNGNVVPSGSPQGSYCGLNTWNVTNHYSNNGSNTLTYDNIGSFYKIIMATLTVKYHEAADLIPTHLKVPGTVKTYQTYLINVTVSNQGSKTVGPFSVRLLNNGAEVGSITVNNLAGYVDLLLSFNWMPTTVGSHFLQLIVDPENFISESNKTNNQINQTVIATLAPSPDLSLSNLNVPNLIYTGTSYPVNVTVSNTGTANASNFTVRLIDGSKEVATQTVNQLNVSESTPLTFYWTPSTRGSHTLLAVVDSENLINESNELNNQINCTVNVVPKLPDLTSNTINIPLNLEVNTSTTINVTVSNIGPGDSAGGHLSLYNGTSLIGTLPLGNIISGGSATYNFPWTPTTVGSHTLRIVVDPLNSVEEENETNNQYSQPIVVKDNTVLNIFLTSDGPGTAVLNMAAQEVLIQYPGRLNIQIRSSIQIKDMSDAEFQSYLSACDIFIGNWISTDVSEKLTRILLAQPSLATTRKVFLILEPNASNVDLMKYSAINGTLLLGGFNSIQLSNYRQNTTRGTDFTTVVNYLATVSFPSTYNQATLYKVIEDKDNVKNEILWAMNLSGFNTTYQNPQSPGDSLQYGIYRYRWFNTLAEYQTIYFQPGRPVVGVIESTAYLKSQKLTVYYRIIQELEARGLNVIPVLAAGGTTDQLKVMVQFFTNATGVEAFFLNSSQYSSYVDAVVQMQAYGLGGDNFTKTTDFFTKLNVPIIRAIHSDYMTNQQWELDSKGLSATAGDRWWHITILEAQGIIEPTFIGGHSTVIDPLTGAAIGDYVPQMDNINRMSDRIKSWTQLKYLPNSEKDVAFIYYNYPPGKNNVGASYLDVIKTIYNLLYIFKAQGYQVENLPATEEDLLDLIIGNNAKNITPLGINIANWVPGEVERMASNPNAILYPVEEYLIWFNGLNELARLRVKEGPTAYIGLMVRRALELNQTVNINSTIDAWEAETRALVPSNRSEALALITNISQTLKRYASTGSQADYDKYLSYKNQFLALKIEGLSGWGEAPGSIMTVERNGKKYFLLPGIRFGKIIIAPEPQRGWEGDVNQLYHNSLVPPHHQYLAAYAYLQTHGIDAMVHLGRHATYEWLPGKEVLLADNDFPSIVTGSVPQIYYYIMDGVAEGVQAKRRGSAVIIDHLTSPMTFTQLYGGLKQLALLANEYEDANSTRRLEIISQVRTIIIDNHLETDIGGDLNLLGNNALIECINSYLSDVQATLYPYGLHVIGERWSDGKIALLVTSMLSVAFTTSGSQTTTLQDQVSLVMKGKLYSSLNAQEKEEVQNRCVELVKLLIHSNANNIALNLTSAPSTDLIFSLEKARIYINALNNSTQGEVASLLNALNGGYVAPGPGSDPVANPDALPTGRNFYHDQAAEIPTLKAYQYGGILALLALQSQTPNTEKIVLGIWCVETARDDGALVSLVLQLLGMKPDWTDSPSAGPDGKKLKEMPIYLELNNLTRPDGWVKKRIDVVVVTSGLFRDLYSRQAMLMDKAFRIALGRSYYTILATASPEMKRGLDYALNITGFYGISNEPLTSNYVAKHWVEDFQYYLSQNMTPEQAGELAICRIFAPPEGDYGAGTSRTVGMSWTWQDRMQLADNYLTRMGHIYSGNHWGTSNPQVFSRVLSGAGTVYTSRNTNLYGVLDNDDFFDYWGGLSLAMERVNGKAPNMYVLSYANRANPQSVSLEQFMNREMTSRYFNPGWIQGMMSHGYDGARYISRKFASNMWGWQVTRPGLVKGWMWDEMANTYLRDKYNLGVTSWLSQGQNSFSMISFTGTLLTAAYDGYWKPDSATLALVANTYQQMIVANGVAGDDVSGGNRAMMKWATQFMNPNLLAQFNQQIYQATGSPGFKPATSTPQPSSSQPSTSSQSGQQSAGQADAGSSPGEVESPGETTPSDQGEVKAYEVSKNESGGSSSESGLPTAAILGVLVLLGLLGFGFFRGRH